MSATVTLSTTTLARGCGVTDTQVQVASVSGLQPGMVLYADRELVTYIRTLVPSADLGPWIEVKRGVGGTGATPHSGGTILTFGRPDQFYSVDPVGLPPAVVPVLPYINVQTGDYWDLQGDENVAGERWWAKKINTREVTSLGIRTETISTSNVTQS